MRDNDFLSLIPHVYAVAEKAMWIQDDQNCDLLVSVACQIANDFQHLDISARLCEERLKYVFTNSIQRVQALYQMAMSCQLMANPQLAQTHLMEALQIIENSSDNDKANLEHWYGPGEFMLGGHICMHLFFVRVTSSCIPGNCIRTVVVDVDSQCQFLIHNS
jgi:hypothetical protein